MTANSLLMADKSALARARREIEAQKRAGQRPPFAPSFTDFCTSLDAAPNETDPEMLAAVDDGLIRAYEVLGFRPKGNER